MKTPKKIILLSAALLIIIATALIIWRANIVRQSNHPLDISEIIHQEELHELTLTIYHLSPFTFINLPLSVEDLINDFHEDRFVISGEELAYHIDLLQRIGGATLIPYNHEKDETGLDARIHYVFEHRQNRRTFSVSMWSWGSDYSIFVNGVEVKAEQVFYDVLLRFLLENLSKDLEPYLRLLGFWDEE